MLNHLKRVAFGFNTLLVLFAVTGCLKTSAHGVATGSVTWINSAAKPVPGIHEGTVDAVTLKHGPPQGVKIVFWGDLSSGKSHGSGSPTGAAAEGQLLANGETRVKYRCETTDGTTAAITIEDQKFDSINGSLFLISTQQGKTQVKQLKFDVGKFPTNTAAIQKLAADNQQIREFFEAAQPTGEEAQPANAAEQP